MFPPTSLKPHAKDYMIGSFLEYTFGELANWIHLFLKRATYRTTPEKRDKDVYDALNYLDMIRFKVSEYIRCLYNRTSQYITYRHHGNTVYVRADLLGRHRDYCLCFDCENFHPEALNCPRANELYQFCVSNGMTTPVWECPRFEEKDHTKD